MTDTKQHDVIEEILRDHQEIRGLLDAASTGPALARQRAVERLVHLLAVHETAEEEVVHPAVRPKDEPVVEELLSEEDEGKKVLSGLDGLSVDDARFDSVLATLRTKVLSHAEHEERTEHPRLRELPENRRAGMATLFRAAEHTAPTHPHTFAPESAIGNLTLGPITALVDRTRDAIRDARRRSGED
jgi:hemerythrin superfamily protein